MLCDTIVVMTTPPVLSKVHTFAQDLERVRGSRGSTPAMKGPVVNSQATQAVTPTAAANPTPTVMASGGLPNTPIKLTADTTRDASYPATIITDKKRRTINLTEEVSSAVGDWWNEKVKSLKGSKKPTYSVPSVERRKGVVHAATTHTGRVATSDHREIV
ncbi:MAG: hypothetical protein MUF19_04280, partial [Candidatus Pacebacteria bacterium]|nr:hypothetical protein [Candidatus Paceibacterota bacterium]